MSINLQKHYPNIEIKPDLLDDLKKKRKKVIKEFNKHVFNLFLALPFLFFDAKDEPIFFDITFSILAVVCLYNCIGIIWNNKLIFSKQKINQLQKIVDCLNENQIDKIQFFSNCAKDYQIKCIKHSSTINHLILEFDFPERYGEKYVVNKHHESLELNFTYLNFNKFCKDINKIFNCQYTNQHGFMYIFIPFNIQNHLNLLFDLSLVEKYNKV